MSQEHWLSENRLSDLTQLGVQFVARSSMQEAYSNGIYNGRPYGGVSIAWSSNLDHVIRPLVNYKHKRIVCVEMAAKPSPILFMSIYMPFFDLSKKQECIGETIEAITMMEEILADHPHHQVIIGGDMNTEFKNLLPFDDLWMEFIRKYDLICCDQYNSNSCDYTYIHDSLNHRKWNDHFLISSSLAISTKSHEIMDVGENPSDHLPIVFQLSAELSTEPIETSPPYNVSTLKWEKCTEEQKSLYKNCLSQLLSESPAHGFDCISSHCTKPECLTSIQCEYDRLIQMMKESDQILPRHTPGVQKHWWSDELT